MKIKNEKGLDCQLFKLGFQRYFQYFSSILGHFERTAWYFTN